MKNFHFIFIAIFLFVVSSFAQKGVDTQTKKITETTGNNGGNNVSRSIDFGEGKTKVRELLPNPYKLNSRRDILVQNIINVLRDRKLIVDEGTSKPAEGIIVTQPFIFARGAVIAKNELNRYAILPTSDSNWRGGRYSLRIEVESIDGIQNKVSVTAKVEGKIESGLGSEWTTIQTSGLAEDEFLAALIETVTGKSVDEPTEKPKNNN
ncbi:MAG: hypothetical protein K1X72_18115 [Pyrinomonadaceae bacterium]|nr:hypothetical protein [Pyrinomonadaceae bacterium]